ncbi:alpha/beta hydrolase [soil metagenome]
MTTPLPLALLDSRFAASTLALPSGARVAVRQCGERRAEPSVVLLHGISSGAASWLHVALALGESAHVVAWDAPGYGESTPLTAASPRADDYAEALHRTLGALQIDSCLLVGHSLGALMGAAYACGLGARSVVRLLLVSPAGGYGAVDQREARERVRHQRHDDLLSFGIEGLAQRTPQRLLSPAADDAARAWVQWNTARLTTTGYLRAVEMLCNEDLGRHAGLSMPVEVLCGDADVVTPPASCQRWAEILSASFAPIHAAGHASPVEQPEAIARAIASAHQKSRSSVNGRVRL